MNIIFGSGVVALMARHILGPSYKIIPDGYSRFYRLNPAASDNFIHCSPVLRECENHFSSFINTKKARYNCGWSVGGDIKRDFSKEYATAWLAKIFGVNIPSQFEHIMPDRMNFQVYMTRTNQLYSGLFEKYKSEIIGDDVKSVSDIKEIRDREIRFKDGSCINYHKAISTIPLTQTARIFDKYVDLPSVDIAVYFVQSDDIDLEGINQALVVDPEIEFFKVVETRPSHYLFYFTKKMDYIGSYLNSFIRDFDIISGAFIENAIPSGQITKFDWVKENGITNVGATAQWDWAMDISSSLYKLLKISSGEEVS